MNKNQVHHGGGGGTIGEEYWVMIILLGEGDMTEEFWEIRGEIDNDFP